VATIQTQGLFGLGFLEIAIILVAAAFVIGPNNVSKIAGSLAGQAKTEFDGLPEELKKIPEEFQKGVQEGEINAKARQAKPMTKLPSEIEGDKKEDS
jgi:sec-independent protein translocase protein TatA